MPDKEEQPRDYGKERLQQWADENGYTLEEAEQLADKGSAALVDTILRYKDQPPEESA